MSNGYQPQGAAAISMLDPMAMKNYGMQPGAPTVQQHYPHNAGASISMMGPPVASSALPMPLPPNNAAASISMMPGPELAHPWSQMPPPMGVPPVPYQPNVHVFRHSAPPVLSSSQASRGYQHQHQQRAPVAPQRGTFPKQQQHPSHQQQQQRLPVAPQRGSFPAASRPAPPRVIPRQPQAPHSAPVNRKEVIKKQVLTTWAFVAPHDPTMKPLSVLLSSIHKVFPPFCQLPTHAHFQSWKPAGTTDKSLRRLRFLLHPDRLPKDLHPDSAFLCEFLWEIISHAVEEQRRN